MLHSTSTFHIFLFLLELVNNHQEGNRNVALLLFMCKTCVIFVETNTKTMENTSHNELFGRFIDDDYQCELYLQSKQLERQRKDERRPNPKDVFHIEFHNNLHKIFGL